MSALLVLNIIYPNVNKKKILDVLTTFKGLQHRLEYVININNIIFINDAKSTNITSTYQALQTINQPIVWIAGGIDQGNQYSTKIINCIIKKVKSIILLGNNKKLFNIFNAFINPILQTDNMKTAVQYAYNIAKSGYVVLLSPACSSFNLFKNYHDRGLQFKKEIKKITYNNNEKKN